MCVIPYNMMKFQFIYLVLCSLTQAAYISRMAVNRMRLVPTAFRPGVSLQRHWTYPRYAPGAHRLPYVLYKNPLNRFTVKHYSGSTPKAFPAGPWKTTARLPPVPSNTPSSYKTKYSRTDASAPLLVHTNGGGIYTMTAPNLSLSEKPIVVADTTDKLVSANGPTTVWPKPTYEVTENNSESPTFDIAPRIELPIGFSKTSTLTAPELQTFVQNGATLQVAPEYSLSAVALPQAIVPQQFTAQGFSTIPINQDVLHSGDGIIITPNALYQPDPVEFLQKVQDQLLQRFSGMDYIKLGPDIQTHTYDQHNIQVPKKTQNPKPNETLDQSQSEAQHLLQLLKQVEVPNVSLKVTKLPQNQPKILGQSSDHIETQVKQQPESLVQTETQNVKSHEVELKDFVTKQAPSSFSVDDKKILVQRETHESVVTLMPEENNLHNITDKPVELASLEPQNSTTAAKYILTESQPLTTTIKLVIESSTEQQKTTPLYFAQIGQSVENIIANGLYTAINDVRAASAAAQVETPTKSTNIMVKNSTTIKPDLKTYFVEKVEKDLTNQTIKEIKPIRGVPFAKKADSLKVAYTLLRTEDKKPKVTKDGAVYAGQIVEASISEDQDFNKEKASLISRRAPLRIASITDKDIQKNNTTRTKNSIVKAKIPPKSKLTFDDKTGEPVLRIYASYVDNPMQKEATVSKLSKTKHTKDVLVVTRKEDKFDHLKSATLSMDKSQGSEANQVTPYGLKIRSRSDDYNLFFEEYDD